MTEKQDSRVLVISDRDDVFPVLEKRQTRDQLSVVEAGTLTLGLRAMAQQSFDIVFIDLEALPEEPLEIILRVRIKTPSADLVAIAPQGDEGCVRIAMEAGAFDCLIRPLNPAIVEFAARRARNTHKLEADVSTFRQDLESAVSTKDLMGALEASILGLAKLVEYRDADTLFHLERISDISVAVARQVGSLPKYEKVITEGYLAHLRRSAALHDVGKVGVPDNILVKPGKLTHDEYEIIKFHSLIGYEAIKEIQDKLGTKRFFHMGMFIAKSHHERWDGTGYPEGLKAERIPLSARIVAVADVYDALTSVRPYKEAYSHERSVEIIVEGSGSQFDPEVVDAFLAVQGEIESLVERWSETQKSSKSSTTGIMSTVRRMSDEPDSELLRSAPGTGDQETAGRLDPGGAVRTRTVVMKSDSAIEATESPEDEF